MNTVAVLSGLYLVLACACLSAEGRRLRNILRSQHKPLTIIPTYLTTTRAVCFYEGQIHYPGSSIGLGFNVNTGNMCHLAYCEDGGHVMVNPNCHEGPPPTPTTIPTTTVTTLPGFVMCFHNGNYYQVGEEIEKGYDPDSNWCYGTICGDNGQLMSYDNFNCHTTPPTTIPPTTIPVSSARPVVG